MTTRSRRVQTFPSVRIPSSSGALPVEVTLISQLGHGTGDTLFADAMARQRAHPDFIDALDEPSVRLGGMDLSRGDASALYAFAVGANGHPFHRHAGHRVFTAISGSGGAQLRFSTATAAQVDDNPEAFFTALRHINIPADCLFTVRFGGETWHQFAPLVDNGRHPALFALSCHTNELGGDLSDPLRTQVLANAASIPALTELLPGAVRELLEQRRSDQLHVPTVDLSLDANPGSLHSALCKVVRSVAGWGRSALARWRGVTGFAGRSGGSMVMVSLRHPPDDSMLTRQFPDRHCHHQDVLQLTLGRKDVAGTSATLLLSRLLDGFVHHPPSGVSRLMALRNALVKPLGLRTATLGCPVSSLLTSNGPSRFNHRHAVLAQTIDCDDRHAQVILGADDKHLVFRTCLGVQVLHDQVTITFGTRVYCTNRFGRLYLAAIRRVHRAYIAPTMLHTAAEHAFGLRQASALLPQDLLAARSTPR